MADSALPKIDLISEKWVKPSSPTPPSTKYYKFSGFDAFLVNKLAPTAFFYPKESFHGVKPSMELLETSLSKTLEYYYPFAGSLADDKISIECNDVGVKLREVQIQTSMSQILDPPADHNIKSVVFPEEMYYYNSASSRIIIQVNHFTCGGICVGICMSHELGDALTLFNFVNDWATITLTSGDINPPPPPPPTPIFSGASIFPPLVDSSWQGTNSSTFMVEKVTNITQRFVFSALSISKLKKMIANDTQIENFSKVDVVSALIFKSLVSASARVSGTFKSSSLCQAVNFRPLTMPPMSNHYVGNFVTNFLISATEEREMGLSRLVTEMKKSKLELQGAFRRTRPDGNELPLLVSKYLKENGKKLWNDNLETYIFTSLCKIPFYQVDFGWGKPMYVFSFMSKLLEKGVLLVDTPSGDGVEALVTLKQDQMDIFQHDKELLAFATLNPNICVPN